VNKKKLPKDFSKKQSLKRVEAGNSFNDDVIPVE